MVRILAVLALAVYVLALLGAGIAQQRRTCISAIESRAARRSSRFAYPRPVVGFNINLHHTQYLPKYVQAIDEIAGLGCTHLQIVTPMFQTSGASDSVAIAVGPGRGPTRAQLVTLLAHAKKRGLATSLVPIVLLTKPRASEWRGKIKPGDWDAWWSAYQRAIDYFVDIAIETDVGLFSVGSELISTEKQRDRWNALIARVRDKYSGLLMYSGNWDHYHVPVFWDQLDVIGASGYWNLTRGATSDAPASDVLLRSNWRQVHGQVMKFARDKGKPFLLTEVGYPSLPWGLKHAWNYVNKEGVDADAHTQARGYDAFFDVWSGDLRSHDGATDRPFFGVFFYAWDPYNQGGPRDTGYGVRGKPALDVVRDRLNALGVQ